MSRITHCAYFPLNIDYWDYYILCDLNIEAARILQRLEFWDGTKGEDNHDGASLQSSGIPSAHFIWKSEEELSWELMGSCGEKRLAACLHFLVNERQYVVSRANPVRRFDRTKQYAVQVQRIQEHLNRLDGLITTLLEAGRQLRPVQYAIEMLTRKGMPIEALTFEQIASQLAELHQTMQEDDKRRANATDRSAKARLPTFIRLHLQKDEASGFCASSPLGKMPVSIPHHDGIESPDVGHRHAQDASFDAGSLVGAIPENTSKNTTRRIQTVHSDRAGATKGDHLHESDSAPASFCPLKKVPVSEPLVSVPSIQRQVERTGKPPTATVIETGGRAYLAPLSCASELETAQEIDEVPHTDLSAETIVGLFEQKRGQVYDAKTRSHQLAAARTLLALQLPLTAELLTHMYDECCDDWWREHYGALHVSHLVECERSHGQPRIVRLLQRVQAKARRKMHPPTQARASSTPVSSLPPEMVGYMQDGTIVGSDTLYGWTGWAYSGNVPEPVRLVQWNGAIVPLDDALKQGYNGGWERFRSGESNDLDALVRKYQAQGILPHQDYLNEGANNDEQSIAR
jgi:hypothetical protein